MLVLLAMLDKPFELRKIIPGIHLPKFVQKYGLRFAKTEDVDTIKNYRKFVVIRNPMDRILSAFHDKLRPENTQWKMRVSTDGTATTTTTLREALAASNATGSRLQRFLKTVLQGMQNEHWYPYSTLFCDFAKFDFDDVIRIESFRHDIKAMLNFAHLNKSHVDRVSNSNIRRAKTRAYDAVEEAKFEPRYLDGYEDIAKADLVKLKAMYKNDLQLFGYDFEVDTLTASCSMTDEHGQTCC